MKRVIPAILAVACLMLVAVASQPLADEARQASPVLQRTVLAQDQTHVMVVGHRGGGFFAPEDTLASIDLGLEVGVDGVEVDVQKTGDGHYILMHDDTVDRTTNGTGTVAFMTLAQIRDLEIRWSPPRFVRPFQFPVPPKSKRFQHLKVPTLEEALDRVRDKAFIMLDLKQEDAEGVARVVGERGMVGEVIFKVNTVAEGQAVRAAAPEAVLMARPISERDLDEMLAALRPPIVHLDEKTFLPEVIDRLHEAGVLIWMNALGEDDVTALVADGDDLAWFRRLDEQLATWWPTKYRPHVRPYLKLAERGADLIQTDNIARVVAAMGEYHKPKHSPR